MFSRCNKQKYFDGFFFTFSAHKWLNFTFRMLGWDWHFNGYMSIMFRNLNLIATWFMFHTHTLFPHESTAQQNVSPVQCAHMGKCMELSRIYFPFLREPYYNTIWKKSSQKSRTWIWANIANQKKIHYQIEIVLRAKNKPDHRMLMQILIRYSMQMSISTKQQQ